MSMEKSQAEQLTHHRELSRIRELAKDKFWHVLREKWPTVRDDCAKHWKGPDAAECQFEKSVMREHIEVFEHGAVMSLVVFAALRLTSSKKFKHVAKNYIKPFFRLTPRPPNIKPATNLSKRKMEAKPPTIEKRRGRARQFKSHLEKQRDTQIERINEAAEAPHDFLVSTLVGISVTFLFFQPKQLRLDFEEAPLSPGRSFWSEHMCEDFIEIYKNTDSRAFDFKHETVDSNLKSFETFTKNCMLRKEYVQNLRLAGEAKPLVLPTNGPWNEERKLL
jgi:hypothetical protein